MYSVAVHNAPVLPAPGALFSGACTCGRKTNRRRAGRYQCCLCALAVPAAPIDDGKTAPCEPEPYYQSYELYQVERACLLGALALDQVARCAAPLWLALGLRISGRVGAWRLPPRHNRGPAYPRMMRRARLLACTPRRHTAIMMDPSLQAVETAPPVAQKFHGEVVGYHRRCLRCDTHLFEPAPPPPLNAATLRALGLLPASLPAEARP